MACLNEFRMIRVAGSLKPPESINQESHGGIGGGIIRESSLMTDIMVTIIQGPN